MDRPRLQVRRISLVEWATIAFITIALSSFFPYFEAIHSANELSRVYLINAMVEEGTVSIDGPLQRLGNIHDKSVREGIHYSDKAPGVSFYGLPVGYLYHYFAETPTLRAEVRVLRLWVSTLPTLLLLIALAVFLREYIRDPRLRALLLFAYGCGSLATTYSHLLFGHQLSAVTVFGCFLAGRSLRVPTLGRCLGIGFLASAAVCLEYQNVVFLLPIAVMFLSRVAKHKPQAAFAAAVLGALPLAIALGAYHNAAFGSVFKTGYSFVASSFAEVHEQGMMGIAQPKLDHFTLSTVLPSKGIFFFAPWLLLALPGLMLIPRAGKTGLVTGVNIGLYILFVSSMVYPIGGWTVAQRHLTPMIPWLILPVGLAVAQWRHLRPLLTGSIVVSVAFTGISTIVWPHFQEQLNNPFFQVGWPLFRDGWLPSSAFNLLGLSSWAGALGLGAVAGLALLFDLVTTPRTWLMRVVYPMVAVGVVAGCITFASDLHMDQDVSADIRWIQSVYEPDPLRPPPRSPSQR
ncbi:MAG: hypothetical protein ACI9OJ_003529 [Myxococcota bacterium]|jgi:hypothetical protein